MSGYYYINYQIYWELLGYYYYSTTVLLQDIRIHLPTWDDEAGETQFGALIGPPQLRRKQRKRGKHHENHETSMSNYSELTYPISQIANQSQKKRIALKAVAC